MLTVAVLGIAFTFVVARALWYGFGDDIHGDDCGCELCLAMERERASPAWPGTDENESREDDAWKS